MLTKYQLFGIINLLISLGLMFLLSKLLIPPVPVTSTPIPLNLTVVLSYLPEVIVLIALIINLTSTYQLLVKNRSTQFKLYVTWTIASIAWVIFTFIGYFFASSLSFLVVSLLITALAYFFIQKLSKKSASFISILTVVVIVFSILASFEENYCWAKGDEELAKTGQEWVTASKEDSEALSGALGEDYIEGQQLSTHFRAHFLCHRNFNFTEALKEKYLLSR